MSFENKLCDNDKSTSCSSIYTYYVGINLQLITKPLIDHEAMQGVNGSIEAHTLEAISIRVMGHQPHGICQLLISKYSDNYMHTCIYCRATINSRQMIPRLKYYTPCACVASV